MRFAIDTGGTFTDLVVEDPDGRLRTFKASSTPSDPSEGIMAVLENAAEGYETDLRSFLGSAGSLLHATTQPLNAVLSGRTARTALLTTEGHRDILLFREGGRTEPFDFTREFPRPYVPRALVWEVPERIGSRGDVVKPLDDDRVRQIAGELAEAQIEGIAVCLLWSPVNPAHEARVGELLAEALPEIPLTLSHRVNPVLREYRRASSACIDASLKPLVATYLRGLDERLRDAGFGGRLLIVTSNGGLLDAVAVAEAPIHAINSGPSMAPVAGAHYARQHANLDTAVVADTGGTSYDVTLVRGGRIPRTRDTWIGPRIYGHLTGFSSVDVKSIGAGGGSIAWVDEGGLLHVGPQSAGADPGPACYSRGGTEATLTDACVVLGLVDPGYFLGGSMPLDRNLAQAAVISNVGDPLVLEVDAAAQAVVDLMTEQMVHAIEDVTVNQGVDPEAAVLVAGGGAAGLNAVRIARRLSCTKVLIPDTSATLSAAGALLADLSTSFSAPVPTVSTNFDFDAVNAALEGLEADCREFVAGPGAGCRSSAIDMSVEARYPRQVWELEVPLPLKRFETVDDVERVRDAFHQAHRTVFAVADDESPIEAIMWSAQVSCRLRGDEMVKSPAFPYPWAERSRPVSFDGRHRIDARVRHLLSMNPGEELSGPAIVESEFSTVVLDEGSTATRLREGALLIAVRPDDHPDPQSERGARTGEHHGRR